MTRPEDILAFWLDEIGPKGWYASDDDMDRAIADRFGPALEATLNGDHGFWLTYPSGALAYLILTDQFPRNIYRGSGQAFAADPWARIASKSAVRQRWDMRIDQPARQFFYLPLMHSELLADQDHCVRLVCERMPKEASTLLHARAHRDIIRRFGRFPFRNAALGRTNSPAEQSFLDNGAYGAVVRDLEMAEA